MEKLGKELVEMEKKSNGFKVAIICILGVLVLTVCVCLIYQTFF